MCVHEYPINLPVLFAVTIANEWVFDTVARATARCERFRPVLRAKPPASVPEHDNEHFDMDV